MIALKRTAIFFLQFLVVYVALGQQTIALPGIINHTRQEYNAGTQNWAMVQDKRGIIYVANNDGLLTYDGSRWQKFLLPNETVVRSLALAPDGKLYIGAQREFGYFQPAA